MTDRSELTTAVGPWNQMMRLLQAWGDTPAGLRAIEYAAAQRDRARQPSPERSEKDSAALRAASRDYLLHDGSGIGRDDEWRGDFDAMALSEARDRLRAALAALPSNVSEPSSDPHANEPGWFDEWDLSPSDPPALDVERLIEAAYCNVKHGNDHRHGCGSYWGKAIAAEYARLSAQPEAQP